MIGSVFVYIYVMYKQNAHNVDFDGYKGWGMRADNYLI